MEYEGGGDESRSNPWLADMQFARQEVVEWKASDGLRLEGVLVYPLHYREGRRYPLILSVHGGASRLRDVADSEKVHVGADILLERQTNHITQRILRFLCSILNFLLNFFLCTYQIWKK